MYLHSISAHLSDSEMAVHFLLSYVTGSRGMSSPSALATGWQLNTQQEMVLQKHFF